jgi:hypothetical protein
MALYDGRYYLYHGAGPALLFFAPWRLMTRHDLPERAAVLAMCFGGFLFSVGSLLRLLAMAGVRPPPWLLAVMTAALGVCQGVPFLLSRVWVYEIAIAGGYFTVSGGVYFLLRAMSKGAPAWFAASGAMFGLAILCRPHLGLAALLFSGVVLVLLARRTGWRAALSTREAALFFLPLALAGAAAAAYNFYRFGDPFEFGTRYLLAGQNQNRVRLAPANVLPGLNYFLFCRPDFEAVFPWFRLAMRYPFDSVVYGFPPEYFIEPLAGAIWLAPFGVGLSWVSRRLAGELKLVLWTLAACSAGVLVFLSATGFTTQRYTVDFLPLALLAAVANCAIVIGGSRGWRRAVVCSVVVAGAFFGMAVSLAIGFSGPYEEVMKKKPLRYVKIARWFSPVERYRPVLDPEIDVHFAASFSNKSFEETEPLFSMGHRASRYYLAAHHADGKVRLESHCEGSTVTYDLGAFSTRVVDYRVVYRPGGETVTVAVDGREVLTHRIGRLVTAPAQVRIGEAPRHDSLSILRFTGKIEGQL